MVEISVGFILVGFVEGVCMMDNFVFFKKLVDLFNSFNIRELFIFVELACA